MREFLLGLHTELFLRSFFLSDQESENIGSALLVGMSQTPPGEAGTRISFSLFKGRSRIAFGLQ